MLHASGGQPKRCWLRASQVWLSSKDGSQRGGLFYVGERSRQASLGGILTEVRSRADVVTRRDANSVSM